MSGPSCKYCGYQARGAGRADALRDLVITSSKLAIRGRTSLMPMSWRSCDSGRRNNSSARQGEEDASCFLAWE